MTVFPMDICNLHELKLIENFWEAYELSKVDLSNNEIPSIPEEIANQEVSKESLSFLEVKFKYTIICSQLSALSSPRALFLSFFRQL